MADKVKTDSNTEVTLEQIEQMLYRVERLPIEHLTSYASITWVEDAVKIFQRLAGQPERVLLDG
jgi:hypothetical protein